MTARILIIDDSEDDQRLYRRALENFACSLEMASTAEEGFARIADSRPDLILLDFNLPDMDGLSVMKRLAEHDATPIPIIMLTGEDRVEVAVEVMKHGANDYLVKDTEGRYLRLLPGVARQVMATHEQRELARRLEKKTQVLLLRNRALMSNSMDGIHVADMDGNIVEANDAFCRMMGYTQEEMSHLNVADWSTEFSGKELKRRFKDHIGKNFVMETVSRRKDGSLINVEIAITGMEINGQNFIFGSSRDITERKRAERALKDAMRELERRELAKTRFLAAAGHDLRQPLTAASLYIDTLRRTEHTHQQDEIIGHLEQAMDTFKALLDALLNISKLDAGAILPEYTSIDVSDLMIWLEESFSPLASEKQIGFRLYFPLQEALAVRSDVGLIRAVLMNLVSNAIKFTYRGGILVSARRRGGDVLFEVWDTGIGIPDEHIHLIFDEFYQINNPQRDRAGGLGLGLSIAERALALLGGKIECRSKAGRGSVFGFRLPFDPYPGDPYPGDPYPGDPYPGDPHPGDPHPGDPHPGDPHPGDPHPGDPYPGSGRQLRTHVALQDDAASDLAARGKRFVVLEDDVLVAKAMCRALGAMGGKVECFNHAEDAMLYACAEPADYFIVDYMLGGSLNGIQFLNLLRQKLGKPINAVVVTGDTSSSFVRSVKDCDWPILHKPVNISQLLAYLGAQEA